jgi:opacity protein-like surface antigen
MRPARAARCGRGAAVGLALAVAIASAVGAASAAQPSAGPAVRSEPLTAPEDRRTPDQTFLTFPEWFLVHSPAEYARFLSRGEPPSAFPLFAHIGQFWQGYAAVNGEVSRFPFNGGYHLMVMVIGTSTTVEYALKGLYEHTLGRLAEATVSGDAPVPEERLGADYAQAYVDFIRIEPWYQFDFLTPLGQLWAGLPVTGPNLIRRWERRFALTTELLVKEGYARLIKLGTQSPRAWISARSPATTARSWSACSCPAAGWPPLRRAPCSSSRS